MRASAVFEGKADSYIIEMDRVLSQIALDTQRNSESLGNTSEIIPASTNVSFDILAPLNNPNYHGKLDEISQHDLTEEPGVDSNDMMHFQCPADAYTDSEHPDNGAETTFASTDAPCEDILTEDPTVNYDQLIQCTENIDSGIQSPSFEEIDRFMNCVELSKRKYHVKFGSTYDCILQMFAAAANEHVEIRNLMAKSKNEPLKLVTSCMNCTNIVDFAKQRVAALKTLFSHRVTPHDRTDEYQIDVSGSIMELWEVAMRKNPSLLKQYLCYGCQEFYCESLLAFSTDNSKLFRSNFKSLEKVFELHTKLYKVQCLRGPHVSTVNFMYNSFIFVQLYCTGSDNLQKKCPLDDIQTDLSLTASYRLSCVVVNCRGETGLFNRRMNGTWFLCWKLFYLEEEYPGSQIVLPYAAFYVAPL